MERNNAKEAKTEGGEREETRRKGTPVERMIDQRRSKSSS